MALGKLPLNGELYAKKVVFTPGLRAALNWVDDEIELCDETGRALAYVLPAELYHELAYAWAKAQFTDDEEYEQARRKVLANGGVTAAEIIAHLESLNT